MSERRTSCRPLWRLALLVAIGATPGCVNMGRLLAPEVSRVTLQASGRWIELNRVAVIDVQGTIASSSHTSPLAWGGTSVADVKERLDRAAADWGVRAVVLRINSPGGDVTGSDLIYQQVMAFRRETGIPVVACLMNVAASGGYYAACAADRIVACPTCVTGSVGVILRMYEAEELLRKVGVRAVSIKTGPKKDIGSFARRMTAEERDVLQGITQHLFDRFIQVIRERRPAVDEERLRTLRDGRIVTAAQALELGMVDELGYLEDAVARAKEQAGIQEADVIAYRSGYDANTNLYAATRTGPASPELATWLSEGLRAVTPGSGPDFMYLWVP